MSWERAQLLAMVGVHDRCVSQRGVKGMLQHSDIQGRFVYAIMTQAAQPVVHTRCTTVTRGPCVCVLVETANMEYSS